MLSDKDIAGVSSLLKPIAQHWYIAPLTGSRAATLKQLRDALSDVDYTTYQDISAAFTAALHTSHSQDIIIVCGSFHTLEAVWESLASWQ